MKITPKLISRLVREEVQAIYREEDEAPEPDEKGSGDEVQSAKDQGMRSDVERVAKFMFKHPQLSKALTKIKGNVEAAQLLGLLAQELGVDPGDISNVMGKVKKGIGDKEESEEEAAVDAKKAGGDEELAESRYSKVPGSNSQNPNIVQLHSVISTMGELVFDGHEQDAQSYIDDAVRNIAKAIDEILWRNAEDGRGAGAMAVNETGRYHRTPYKGEDPRAQAFDQAITILDDQVFDSLEGDVAEYADEAVRALSKAIEELEYQRNTVGNLGDAEKQAVRDYEASQRKEDSP